MFGFLKKSSKLRKIEQQQAVNRRKIESSVCATVARGNISLQQGEYITSEDMDVLQKQLTAYFSSEQSKW
jgi:hypothetical protein